ncbi:hypothetical protein H8959_016026 [Pygathrix nigripes]
MFMVWTVSARLCVSNSAYIISFRFTTIFYTCGHRLKDSFAQSHTTALGKWSKGLMCGFPCTAHFPLSATHFSSLPGEPGPPAGPMSKEYH